MNMQQSPSGKIVKSINGYKAFVPNPLPPEIEWDIALVTALSRADHLLGQLSREASKLPNPYVLMRPFVAREAVLSSKIEGTQATIGEILADEAGVNVNRNQDDLQEVKNYITALEYGLQRLKDFPLSLRVIKEIHGHLMQGVRGSHATPGEFRYTQNWIGAPGSTIATAKYIPPMPGELMNCLGAFELFLYETQLPPLIHIALCHYQFEAIHPFLDGNGRIGRLLISFLLVERKMLPSPILYISAFFEATREEYYRQLYNVSAKGTWHEWLTYFLNGIAVQSEDALSRASRINALVSEWKLMVASGKSRVLIDIVEQFAVNPFLTTTHIAQHFNIAFTTAQRALKKLESLDIITQVVGNKRDRVYCATAILDILEEPAKI